jgi:hypothetical protein
MTKIKAGVISAVVAASVATSLVVYNQAQARLRQQESSAREYVHHLEDLGYSVVDAYDANMDPTVKPFTASTFVCRARTRPCSSICKGRWGWVGVTAK